MYEFFRQSRQEAGECEGSWITEGRDCEKCRWYRRNKREDRQYEE